MCLKRSLHTYSSSKNITILKSNGNYKSKCEM
uniref:Uncharacterized protein n=1 Tax=Arundo donax TaxID=35708 RepID=A0A0A9A9C2_ARUDO